MSYVLDLSICARTWLPSVALFQAAGCHFARDDPIQFFSAATQTYRSFASGFVSPHLTHRHSLNHVLAVHFTCPSRDSDTQRREGKASLLCEAEIRRSTRSNTNRLRTFLKQMPATYLASSTARDRIQRRTEEYQEPNRSIKLKKWLDWTRFEEISLVK